MALNDLLKQETFEEEVGAWLPLPCGGEMLVRFIANDAFKDKLRRLEKKWRMEHRKGLKADIPFDDQEMMVRDALVGTCCVEIRGVKESEKDKEPIESTPENIRRLLDSRRIRGTVTRYIAEEETFEKENLDLIAGN